MRFHDASESKCTETAMATGTGDCHLVFISREKASEKMLRYKQFEINMLRSYQKRVRRQEREIEKLQMKRALLMKPQTTSDSVGGQNDLPGQISTAVGHPVPSCAHHILFYVGKSQSCMVLNKSQLESPRVWAAPPKMRRLA